MELPKGVIPAIRKARDFDKALETTHDSIVFLETRLSQLKSLVDYTRRANKQVLIHFDLIQGLRADEYGMEFLIREIKPDGILSTRGNIITLAKKHKLLAIQRMFLLDSLAVEQNVKLIERSRPDCIEVLPGILPGMIEKIHKKTSLPIIAGGLITMASEVNDARDAGAVAITTSKKDLWDF